MTGLGMDSTWHV